MASLVCALGVVSSTFQIAQILVQSHFELVCLVLALEVTEPVSEPVTQMAAELIQSLTKAIIFELFYYINGYFRV